MISNKNRDNRRSRMIKMSKTLQRLCRESKCTECSVVVTRMDFAKILGKFTKVKIQYESSSTPKPKRNNQEVTSPNSRLKRNENGMVLLHRNAYTQHPVTELINKKSTGSESPRNKAQKENAKLTDNTHQVNNILKENNRLKKTPLAKKIEPIYNNNKIILNSNFKQYGIIFENPHTKMINEFQNKLHLTELLPCVNKSILPSEDWFIDYLPKDEEPKDDKVYDRIAAELEDLMYNKKPEPNKTDKRDTIENKVEEFPSIMDILNEKTTEAQKPNDQSRSTDFKSNLESSDVEAMLLGKSSETKKTESVLMEVDSTDMSKLIDDVVQLHPAEESGTKLATTGNMDVIDNPQSPSILDETLQKGIEEHLPIDQPADCLETNSVKAAEIELDVKDSDSSEMKQKENNNFSIPNISTVTHVVFKRCMEGNCLKSVMCPRNLKYSIELEGKSVEFVGAPKFISSLEDLKVLLQIVDESDLKSPYVLH